jgi:hypothetical protein
MMAILRVDAPSATEAYDTVEQKGTFGPRALR